MGKWRKYWEDKGHQRRVTVEECAVLDIANGKDALNKYPMPDRIPHAMLLQAEVEGGNVPVAVSSIPRHLGGVRWYFHCPACKRRCTKLYVLPGGSSLRCRKCHGLSYQSRQLTAETLAVAADLDVSPNMVLMLGRHILEEVRARAKTKHISEVRRAAALKSWEGKRKRKVVDQ